MYCFNLKNRLGFVSLAILASSSSLLAMDEMEIESPYLATQGPMEAIVMPLSPRESNASSRFNQENNPPRTKSQRPDALNLEADLNRAQKRIKLLETKLETHQHNSRELSTHLQKTKTMSQNQFQALEDHLQSTMETNQTKIKALQRKVESDQIQLRDLKNHLEKTEKTDKTKIKTLKSSVTGHQAKIQELENSLKSKEKTHQDQLQKLEEDLNNTQAQNKEVEKLREQNKTLERQYLLSAQQTTKAINYYEEKITESQAVFWDLRAQITQKEEEKKKLKAQITASPSSEKYQELMTAHNQLKVKYQHTMATNQKLHDDNRRLELQLQNATSQSQAIGELKFEYKKLQATNNSLKSEHQEMVKYNHQVTEDNQRLSAQLQDAQNKLLTQQLHTWYTPQPHLPSTTGPHPSFSQWGNGYRTNQPIQSNHVFPASWGENPKQS